MRRLLTLLVGLQLVCTGNALASDAGPTQWHLSTWSIEQAWHLSRGKGIGVAIVDGHVDASHPDLVGQVVDTAGDAIADSHGTATAALIAASGKGATFGVAPDATVYAFSATKSGADHIDPELTARSIRAAADSPARIINLSIAFGVDYQGMRDAVAYAQLRGKLVVAGGGNVDANGPGPVYPAAYPGVLGVSAIDRHGRIWSGSNRGPWISLAAPGVDVVSACTAPSRYCSGTGSSGAAALTSGVAALVWAVHPDWTANQVIRRLVESANRNADERIPNDEAGFGVVSPRKALASTAPPGPADVNPLLGRRGATASAAPEASASSVGLPDPAVAGGVASPVPARVPSPVVVSGAGEGTPDSSRPRWWWLALVPLPLLAWPLVRRFTARRGRPPYPKAPPPPGG